MEKKRKRVSIVGLRTPLPSKTSWLFFHSGDSATAYMQVKGLGKSCREIELDGGPGRRSHTTIYRRLLNLRGGSKGNFHFHPGPSLWCAIELKRPMQLIHALSHVDHPRPTRLAGLGRVATNTVIGHRKTHATVGTRKPNLNLLCLPVQPASLNTAQWSFAGQKMVRYS